MRICVAQTRIKAAALEDNFKEIASAVQSATAEQADLIVFPEMALPGYFIGDAWERPSFLNACEELTHRVASLSSRTAIVFGSVGIDRAARNEDGRIRKYNAAFVAHDGRLLQNEALNLPFWPKTLLPNYREFDDSRHFYDLRKLAIEFGVALSSLVKPLSLKLSHEQSVRIGLGICEDAWADDYSVHPYEILSKDEHKPDLMINISCSPFTLGKQDKRRTLFSRLVSKSGCPVVYVNAVGSQNVGKTIFSFDGDSGIYSHTGFSPVGDSFLARTKTFDVPLQKASKQKAPTRIMLASAADRAAEICRALESGLNFLKEEWSLNRVVIGVSGGIDSALSAVLHTRVFGAENVFCVNMPSSYNSPLTIAAAKRLSAELGCCYTSVGIEESVRLTLSQLDAARTSGFPIPESLPSLVAENIQARDRGARLLAGIASALGAVFPCNANKSEMTIGYSTLYGDHAGYLAPLADLWKGDVYALARHYNKNVFGREVIPEETLSVVPSAELSSEQDVTQGKGDPLCYPYHDALFRLWVEEWNRFDFQSTLDAWDQGTLAHFIGPEAHSHLQQLFKTRADFCRDLKKWWSAYTTMGAFKRVQSPPVLALTRRAFGFDHREAIGIKG
jgi:NAD+ synthase (glutamine-hydrolysing)